MNEPDKSTRREFLKIAAGTAAVVATSGGVPALVRAALAAPGGKFDVPALRCLSNTPVTITLDICAGATGAPAGFSVQWMTVAEYQANGNQWYLSSDSRLCKASFSGAANNSRFNLGPNVCTTVEIGNLFDEEPGVSYNCNDDLTCGTEYVFRAFAHANNLRKRSDFTPNHACTTADCNGGDGCTFTQGYWKTHGPIPTGNNSNEWPVTELTLGSVLYSDLELLSILNSPAQGNGLLSLAHQLIAAKLNIANGSDGSVVASAISDADALIGGLVIPPVGNGSLPPGVTSALNSTLTAFNEGAIGPGHCS